IVVAIDPAATAGEDADETGIIVVGKDTQGHGYVLADASGKYQPIGPARARSKSVVKAHIWSSSLGKVPTWWILPCSNGRNSPSPRIGRIMPTASSPSATDVERIKIIGRQCPRIGAEFLEK